MYSFNYYIKEPKITPPYSLTIILKNNETLERQIYDVPGKFDSLGDAVERGKFLKLKLQEYAEELRMSGQGVTIKALREKIKDL